MANILLVDDNDLFREAIQKLLMGRGHNVISAKNGKLADELQRKNPSIELVICDIKMPEFDGRDLTRRIRARNDVPVILITGFSEITETLDAIDIGANAFLAKPFQSQDLFDAIDDCLSEENPQSPELYCRLDIENFANGRQIKFPIFVRLSECKFVKIACNGENISPDRIVFLKQRGVLFLYLRAEDYRSYIAQSIEAPAPSDLDPATRSKKLELLEYCRETLASRIKVSGLDEEEYESARAFLEAAIDIFSDSARAIELLDSMRKHTDFLLSHRLGVSLYSVMMAHQLNWILPQNRYKLVLGGLFRDIPEDNPMAKLVAVADKFCCRVLNTGESEPISPIAALEEMKAESGDVLEEKFVEALVSLVR